MRPSPTTSAFNKLPPSLSELLQATLQIICTIPVDAADLADAIAMHDVRRIADASQVGIAWAELRATHAEAYVDAAWDASAIPLRPALATGLSFFGKFKSSYRQASKVLGTLINGPLPPSVQKRIALVDPLIAVERAYQQLKDQDAEMGSFLPSYWRGPRTDFALLQCVSCAVQQLSSQPFIRFNSVVEVARHGLAGKYISGLKQLSDTYARAVDSVFPVLKVNIREAFNVDEYDKIPLRSVALKADAWRESQSQFDEWRRLAAADARVRAQPAIALADGLATGRILPASVKSVLACTFAETVWSKAVAATPELGQFYGPAHETIVEEFRRLEAEAASHNCPSHSRAPRRVYATRRLRRNEHHPLRD